ncbi:MAG TPA: hypothetical protein PKD84_06865 [Propionicimonas sp.]|nr:hypothetical protein [Propionicimonas sp.]
MPPLPGAGIGVALGEAVGAAEVGAAEVGAAEVGGADVGAVEVGAAEVGGAEVGAVEVGAVEVGAIEVGSRVVEAEGDDVEWVGNAVGSAVGIAVGTVMPSHPVRVSSRPTASSDPIQPTVRRAALDMSYSGLKLHC